MPNLTDEQNRNTFPDTPFGLFLGIWYDKAIENVLKADGDEAEWYEAHQNKE